MRSFILTLAAALLLVTSPASAGGGAKGDWELGVYGGYGWLDDYGIFHPKDNLLYGGRLGYFLTPQWSTEVSAQHLGTETEFDVLGVPNTDFDINSYRLNLLYNFGAGKSFRPFLTAGVGREDTSIDNFGESCDIGWNAGAGARLFLSPHWNLRGDGRFISTSIDDGIGESQQNVEATLGLGFAFGGGETEAEVAEVPNQAPTVSCASDRPELLPGENVTFRASATDPEMDPLTYEWSSSVGRVTGAGATAMFDFTGVTPPSTATVTVRASDNHGHTATSECSVSLREPARPAEAVSCLAGGFARNASRLNNVDKACLDDMAQRLQADPRAHVIVIGHADPRESSASSVAEQRANAVKDYVVLERGIDGSRITVRNSAATRPMSTGTDAEAQSRNRRVEVWFVPQGASDPQ